MLTLHEAVKTGRLLEFINQEESRGIGPIALSKMDAGIAALIRARRALDGVAAGMSAPGGVAHKAISGRIPSA